MGSGGAIEFSPGLQLGYDGLCMGVTDPILLRGGRLIDPASGTDKTADLLLENGRIKAIEFVPGSLQSTAAQSFNLDGLIIAPGLLDIHVHLREPGQGHKETLETGAAAAVHGGFTTVCCMPNTSPALDSAAWVDYIRLKSAEIGMARVYTVGAATVGRRGEQLAPMQSMAKAGAVGFSDDGDCIVSAGMMDKVLRMCRIADRPFMQHCQDHSMTEKAVMHAGSVSAALGLRGWPREAEEIIIERDIRLNREIGASYHAQHVSSGGSVEILRRARQAGFPVTGEVAPHHLLLTHEACRDFNTQAKMNPPLREDSDIRALKEAVAEGVITVLATDHAPHSSDEKLLDFESAPFGIIGLDCALPLYAKALIDGGVVDWPGLLAMMTIQPARLTGLDRLGLGSITAGGPADVTVIDPDHTWTIDVRQFKSKSRNCPFDGWNVRGSAPMVIVGGRILKQDLARRS